MRLKKVLSYLVSFCFISTVLFANLSVPVSALGNVSINVDISKQGATIGNRFNKMSNWDKNQLWGAKATDQPTDYFSQNYPFIKQIDVFFANGGSYTSKSENITYTVSGITGAVFTGFFEASTEPISDLRFWYYRNGAWAQATNWTKSDTSLSNGWTKRVYTISSFPTGITFLRIDFPIGGAACENPQLGKVVITETNSITDEMNDWSKVFRHTDNLVFDTSNGTQFQDTSRVKRTNNTNFTPAERVTYNYSGITAFEATGLFSTDNEPISDFRFYSSPDNNTWTQITGWTKTDTPINNNLWTKRVYTISSLPAGTNYIKVYFPTGGTYSWNTQLGQVKITAGSLITDDLDNWSASSSHSSGLAFDTSNQVLLGDSSRVMRTNNYDGYPGCVIDIDTFKEPNNRNVLDDYDFSKLITACHNILNQGLKPLLKTGNVPIKYSSNPNIGGMVLNNRPPDNYNTYYNYIKAMADALVSEFGIDEVRLWSWGVLSEYGNRDWYEAADGTGNSTKIEFFKLYDYTVAALEASLGASYVKVGVHALGVQTGLWDELEFIDHCAFGTNYKTGLTGTQIDYIDFSYYGLKPGDPGDFEGTSTTFSLSETVDRLRNRAIQDGLTNLTYSVGEGGTLYGPETGNVGLAWRQTGASYEGANQALLFKKMCDLGIDTFSKWSLNTEVVWGATNGVDGVATHIDNLAYKMVNDSRVDTLKTGDPADCNDIVDAIAGFDSSGNTVHIMVFNFNKSLTATGSEDMTLKINNIQPVSGSTVTVKKWIVDDTHANFWPTWWSDRVTHGCSDITNGYSIYTMEAPSVIANQPDKDYWYSRVSIYRSLDALSYTTTTPNVSNNTLTLSDTLAHHGVIFYEITNAKLPTTPDSKDSIVDNLNDWSKCYSHTAGLTFDTTNPSILKDDSRVIRINTNSSPAENIVYHCSDGITGVTAFGLFASEEPISNFIFYTSPNGSSWTQQTGWTNIDQSIGGGWTRREYTLNSIPTDTQYVKIEFPTGGTYFWNPNLGQVSIIRKRITDNLDNWRVCNSHMTNLTFDTSNAIILEDSSRAMRTDTSPAQSVVYYALGIKSVKATMLFATDHEPISDIKLYTSSDRLAWTQQMSWTYTDTLINGGTWTRRVYTYNFIPARTNYAKIEFPTGGSYVWNPQLSKVEVVY